MFYSAFYSEFVFAVATAMMFGISQPISSFASSIMGWTMIGMIGSFLSCSWICVIIQQIRNWRRNAELKAQKELKEAKEKAETETKKSIQKSEENKSAVTDKKTSLAIEDQVIYYKKSVDRTHKAAIISQQPHQQVDSFIDGKQGAIIHHKNDSISNSSRDVILNESPTNKKSIDIKSKLETSVKVTKSAMKANAVINNNKGIVTGNAWRKKL